MMSRRILTKLFSFPFNKTHLFKLKPNRRLIFKTNNYILLRNSACLSIAGLICYKQFSNLPKIASCRRFNGKKLRQNTSEEIELFDAIRQNDIGKVKKIIGTLDVNYRHSLGWTPLHLASVLGKSQIVKLLLDSGADPNAIDEFSNAAQISYESQLNYQQVYQMREQDFSNILSSQVSFLGTTALHYACLASSLETIKVLMESHANPNLENEFGHLPVEYLNDEDPKIVLFIPEFEKYCAEYDEYLKQAKLEERRKFPLEQRLHEMIVGQDGAIATVAASIRRKENGWTDSEHPLVFLFLGSSGIGKTELAKQVANYLHNDKTGNGTSSTFKGFIRIDMSEYQEKHEVSKFIGSPPGYIGHDEGGQLTKALKDCPNAVVLFDEVEKAHPDILTIMLQLFDEGRLTDGKGRTIQCKDAIFIMTSNLASEEIADYGLQLRRESEELAKAQYSGKFINETDTKELEKVVVSRYFKDKVIRPILKRHFKRDEFLGRINEIVYFLPFSRSELHKLVTRELELWAERAKQRHKINLSWNRNVIGVLANGYDVHYGARSIKYEVERRVVNKLANAHENQLMLPGAKVHLVVSDDGEEFDLTELNEVADSNDDFNTEEIDYSSNVKTVEHKLKLLIENPPTVGVGSKFSFFR